MKIRFLFLIITITMVVAVLFVGIKPVSATPPTNEEQHWSGADPLNCGDFTATDNWDMYVTLTYYWNSDGTMDRYHVYGEAIDQITNTLNGKVIYGRTEGYNFFEDVEDTPGLWKHAGLMFHFVVPGQGTVLVDAGFFYMYEGEIIYMKGNHEFNTGHIEELCAALR